MNKKSMEAEKAKTTHCPNCWQELDERRWTKDYKGYKWVVCPRCGEKLCLNPND